MLVHVLRFRFKADVTSEAQSRILTDLRNLAASSSTFSVVGVDLASESQDYTHTYCAAWEGIDAFKEYLAHPDHSAVVHRVIDLVDLIDPIDFTDDLNPELRHEFNSMRPS